MKKLNESEKRVFRNICKELYNSLKEMQTVKKEESCKTQREKGIVRFAIFLGLTKYIENHLNDPEDASDIKKQRLLDESIDQSIERLTMRISDHDGKWSANYDSAYLGKIELDNGIYLHNKILALKEYTQQIPLSFHYVNASQKKGEEDYSIL